MITRRQFISDSCMATSALMLPNALFAEETKSAYKMGLQLFTIRDAMAKDPFATIKQVAALGYEDTETYGFDPKTVSYYGLKAKDFLGLLSDHGLTTTSGHYDLFRYFNAPEAELMAYVDQCIIGAGILKQPYITWPWLDPNNRSIEQFKQLAPKLNRIGERIKKAGLGFAYHNHNFEFIDHGGINGYEIIMKETDPDLVKLQIDLYWVMRASKLSPAALFSMQPGRFVMWHIKDMDKVTQDYTELGNGSIDYTKILPDKDLAGMEYYYLEQGGNFKKSSMESIAESAAFFKKNLAKYFR
ncbi:TIM barrel protein [Olivibacter sp. 47]|uniref:sugar phosphate isomerase/epimerase family protein n=1 Tax=unclassified Olivibacter TaxID=2632301 RepID=UPI001FEE0FBA|nr:MULTISPECIES: TIM barrel protein [unclassified Olivibacter]MDM8175888.1 TIM barrel protein [Olivibacter sp. 47]